MNKTFLLVVLSSSVQDQVVAEDGKKALEAFRPTIKKYKLADRGNEFRIVEKDEYNAKVASFFDKL